MRVETKIARRIFALFLGFFALALSSAVQAAPKDGRIVRGSGSITQSGTHTDIHQQSDFLATRWDSFNIATHESVQAHQPSSTSRLLIRVDGGGGGATNIAGTFTANGITILENQNGVQFSRGAIVNVGGLLATSSRISGVAGANWQLNGTGGAVINHGQIVAGAGGAILAAVKVQNTGDITSKGGDVALGAGSSFTVDFAGSMVGFEVKQAASGASIANTGKIESQGGIVSLSAQEAQAVRTNVVSVGGVVKATKMERRGGVVYLSGGEEGVAEVSGDVQASEKVQTTGEYIVVKEGALLKAPNILVGGDLQGREGVQTAKRTLVEAGALLNAGANGRVIVWSDETTWFNGDIIAPEGFAEVSGKEVLASINLAGIDVGEFGTLLLDPLHISIVETSDTALPDAGILFADPPGDGRTEISAALIGAFVGALELQARGGIQIRADITSTSLTSLTLRAQDADGSADNTQNGGAGADTNNITFFGTTVLDLGSASLNLIAGVINIRTTNNAITTITARDGITFRYTRDRLNQATAEADHITGTLMFGEGTALTYAFGLEVEEPAPGTDCAGVAACTISSGVVASTLTARTSITLDFGENAITFGGRGPITITSQEVTITAATIDLGGRSLTITSSGATLALNLNADISNGGTLNIGALDKTLTFRSTEDELTLAATNISLLSNNNIRFAGSLDLAASGLLTLNTSLSVSVRRQVRNLTLGATTGAGRRIRFIPRADGFGTEITIGQGTLTINSEITNIVAGQPNEVFPTSFAFLGGTRSTFVLNADINIAAYPGSDDSTHLFSLGSRGNSPTATLILGGNRTIKTFGNILYGVLNIDESGTLNMETGQGGNDDFTLQAGGILTISGEDVDSPSNDVFDINLGTGELILTGTDVRDPDDNTLMTAGISIAFNTGRFAGKAVTLNGTVATIMRGATGGSADTNIFSITTRGGNITLNDDINLFSFFNVAPSGSIILDSDTAIVLGQDVTLTATDVRLTGAIDERATPRTLTIMTFTRIRLNSDIDLGSGTLTLTASDDSAFGGFIIPADGITLAGGAISLTGEIEQDFLSPSFTITAAGVLTLNGNIDTGTTGDLTLTGTNGIVLGGDITLIGAAISLTGAIDESAAAITNGKGGRDDLTITASGLLTLGGSINLGTTGTLSITVDGRITVPNSINITAASPVMFEFTDRAVTSPALGFTVGGGASTVTNLNFVATTPSYDFPPLSCAGMMTDCVLGGDGTGGDLRLPEELNTSSSITVNAGPSNITFAGEGPILITSQTVTITAGSINITGARTLTITTLTGAITLNTAINGPALTAIRIIAGGGVLTLGGNINGGTGPITLSGVDQFDNDDAFIAGGIQLSGDITLQSGGDISLTGTIDEHFGDTDDLTIMAGGIITLNNNIELGAGNLTLSGTDADITNNGGLVIGQRGIVLGMNISLSGAAITLTGEIDESSAGRALIINAAGNLTINSDINLGAGQLSLTADSSAGTSSILTTASTKPVFTSVSIVLRQNTAFANAAGLPFSLAVPDDTTGFDAEVDVTVTNAAQTIHDWMIMDNRGLSLRVLGASSTITIAQDMIDLRNTARDDGGFLTLQADDITFTSADLTLFAAGVSLNGRVGSSGSGNLNIMATVGSGTVSFSGDVALGRGTLSVMSGGSLSIGNLTFFADTLNLTFAQESFSTSSFSQNIFTDGEITNLSLTNTAGRILVDSPITLAGNITLNGVNTASQTALAITSDITSTGGNIILGDGNDILQIAGLFNVTNAAPPLTLSANNITLNGNVSVLPNGTRSSKNDGSTFNNLHGNLILIATTGDLTINADFIDVGFGGDANNRGRLVLQANSGSITHTRLTEGSGLEIVARDEVILSQRAAFAAANPLSDSTDIDEVRIRSLTIITAEALPIRAWMIVSGRNLSLTSTSAAIMIDRDIALVAGNLTLTASALNFSGGARSLTGANITLNGVATNAGALTINATGTLTLNGNITTTGAASNLSITGTGGITTADGIVLTSDSDLTTSGVITTAATNGNLSLGAEVTINLGGNIILGTGTATLTAGSDTGLTGTSQITAATVRITLDGEAITRAADVDAINDNTITFVDADGTVVIPDYRFGAAGCGPIAEACNIMGEGVLLLLRDLRSNISITIDAGITGTVRFRGAGAVRFEAPVIRITAATIDIGGRAVRIVNASGATLTLVGNVVDAAGITAQNGGNIHIVGARSITGGAINITAGLIQTVDASGSPTAGDLTITATDGLIIATNINTGTGALTLTAGMGATTGDISNSATTRTLTAGSVILSQDGIFVADLFMINSAASLTLTTAATAAQTVESWMHTSGRNLSLTSTGGAIMIGGIIDIGAGNITLSGIGTRGIVLSDTLNLSAGDITLTGAIDENLHNVLLIAVSDLTLNSNIDIGSADLVLSSGRNFGDGISLGDNITIAAGTVGLSGAIDQSMTPRNLTVRASRNAELGGNINLGTGTLTVTAGVGLGTGNIVNEGTTRTLTAGTVNFTQDGTRAFTATDWVIASNTLTIETVAAQTLHPWMVAAGRTLTLTSTGGALTLNGTMASGAGDLILTGTAITLGGPTTLTGRAITLTGAISAPSGNNALAITATGDLTLNNDINIGTGALTLGGTNIFLRGGGGTHTLAGAAVMLTGILDSRAEGAGAAGNNIVITAGTGDIMLTGSIIASGNGGVLLSGNGGNLNLTATSGNIMITGDITTTGGNGLFDDNTGDGSEDGGNGGNLILTATGNITIGGNINLDAERGEDHDDNSSGPGGNGGNGGGLTLTTTGGNITLTGSVNANGGNGGFVSNSSPGGDGGAGGVITLEGDSVMVGLINARSGSGGTHTGEGSLGSDGVDGRAMITASGGNLTLNGNINVDGGQITLEARGATAAILNGSAMRTLTAGTVSLTQVAVFADTALFTFTTPSLTLETAADQTVLDWMTSGSNRSLSITSTGGALTLNSAINTGTGDLTLGGADGIMLSSSGGGGSGGVLTLEGMNISITSSITGTDRQIIITAITKLTLGGDVNTGIGNLQLQLGTDLADFTNVRLLSGREVAITSSMGIMATDGDLTISALRTLQMVVVGAIDVGAFTLFLEAGRADDQVGAITFAQDTILRGAGFTLTQDGAVFPTVRPVAFQNTDGTPILRQRQPYGHSRRL